MYRPGIVGERALALFVIALLAISPPLLSIFNRETFAFGVPLLYVYLLGVWAGVILLVGIHARAAAKQAERERALQGERQDRPEL